MKIIDDFIKEFENAIMKCVHYDDKILLHLTGGYDTRSILSVLLNNDVDFDCITGDHKKNQKDDVEIASKITDIYNIRHLIKDTNSFYDLFIDGYDKHISGILMSEYLNKYNLKNINNGYEKYIFKKHISTIYNVCKKYDIIIPMIDGDLLDEYFKLNKRFLCNNNIQKNIIKCYCSGLLNIPFTRYD